MKRLLVLTLLFALVALAVGCGAPQLSSVIPAPAATAAPAMPPVAYDQSTGAAANESAPGRSPASDAQAQADARMIVYTGSLSLQVNDTAQTIDQLETVLKNVNGYISSKSVVAYGKDKLRGTVTVRIPSAALDTTIGQIKALGIKVLKEDASSNDVTAEYVDLDARRKNLEAYEVELTKLLDTVRERTGKAEDILAVYNQLTEVRGQIEQIKGRQNYLENTSTLATYTIELVPVEEVVVEGNPGWDPGRTAGQSLDQLVAVLQGLGDLAIRLVLLVLPVLVVLLLPLVILALIIRAIFRRRTPRKTAPAS